MSARLALIAAIAENGVIGDGLEIPWRLSTDMKRFKALTMGKPVLMGRVTFETLGKPLPGRTNIVVSRETRTFPDGVQAFTSMEEAVDAAKAAAGEDGEVMVLGGTKVFTALMADADRLYVTHVEAAPDGDCLFPTIEPATWRPVSEEKAPAGPKDEYATRFVVYDRVTPTG